MCAVWPFSANRVLFYMYKDIKCPQKNKYYLREHTWWPSASVCDPIIIDFMPDEHTLLMVVHTVLVGSPPKMAACRAGAWPTPADTTLPM